MDCQQVNRIIRVDGSMSQEMGSAETVTISLEDAAQIILQEQVMDGTLQIPPGTYHILTQDTLQVDENRLIVAGSDGMPVIMQSASNNLQNYTVQTEDGEANISEVVNTVVSDGTSMDILQVAESNEDLQLPQQTTLVAAAEPVNEEAESAEVVGVSVNNVAPRNVKAEDAGVTLNPMGLTNIISTASSAKQDLPEDQSNQITEAYPSADNAADTADATDTTSTTAAQSRKPDLTCPIAVTERTEVVINGKKCVMMLNSETGQMCAYPLLPPEGRRKRGRPRKQPRVEEPALAEATESPELPLLLSESTTENTLLPKISLNGSQEWTASEQNQSVAVDDIKEIPLMSQEMLAQTEQTNAAEGLLELSATGPDGVRRSGRIRRKAKTLEDYEILEISSEDEGATAPDDEEVTPAGVKRKRPGTKDATTLAPFLLGPGMKRGRGRPRRFPPAGPSSLPTQIPAVIIPTSGGQTLMMASVPGIQNMQAFQQQIKQLPTILHKSVEGQGTEDNNNQMLPVSLNTEGITVTDSTSKQQQQQKQQESLVISATDNTTENAKTDGSTDDNEEISKVHSKTAENSTSQSVTSDEGKSVSESSTEVITSSAPPTIIQIPENFLPMFLPKKDPIKLGLKATENDLERLRCNKCQFQAYYQQQFQEHLSTNHPETVQKCKCCTYVSLDKTDLYNHFKENHPRCLCHVCGFTSEHAYVIKRHMMRHSADGCTCELCGKTYKDQYILKMHVKMVHLPAEVLYECTICAKKFTRKAHLKRHLRIHDPEKPYKCPHCEYRGCERSDISKHVLIHDEQKHICEVCGKAFRHIKNKELHVKRHKGQRDYKCGVCDFFGYTFTDIRKHIERKHSDLKTLDCDKCSQTFHNESLLIEHQKQKCEVTMIEQALTIATSTGTTEARIQIPTSLSVDGQHITIGSQQIPMDTSQQVNITVEQLNLTGNSEDGEITLTESNPLGGSEIAVASQTEQFEDISADPSCVLTEGTGVSESVGEEGEMAKQGPMDIFIKPRHPVAECNFESDDGNTQMMGGMQKPLFVICGDVLAKDSMKPSNLKRHLNTKHKEMSSKLKEFFERK
ncbi:XP_029640697.2LOW QUALITY PROTEIN: uncharacterized protein LOC115215614 [Octopus vulgaris]|uniref:XP_029640697.2LOW QUALITY PROTEIN: uncharacterized protein LOC115215614 n=1 Tax=Octopus vulgaris TaxID=6645 RepID=A0AA36F964_OCTVU|nr:XP_029640697.2LOW QUALITY PROTEIN: uncharacterized protein LOC115215614 [Octopus vulgaris]